MFNLTNQKGIEQFGSQFNTMVKNHIMASVIKLIAFCSIFVIVPVLLFGCSANPLVYNQNKSPVHYSTYASLSPDATSLGPYLGLRIIGKTQADGNVPGTTDVPIVASTKPNYELIAKLHPDVIIYDSSLYGPSDIEKIKQLGIPTLELTGDTVDQFIKCLFKIASVTNSEMQVNGMVNHIYEQMEAAKSDPITQPNKTALIMLIPHANPMIAGTNSFYADLVRISGGTPVGPSDNKFDVIDPEHLIALNPDCIVIAGTPADAKTFASDPRYSQLKAIKKGNYFSMEQNYILRRGSQVADTIKALHRALGQVLRRS